MVASHLQIWEWYRWRRRWGWKYTFNILCLLLPSTVNIVEWSLEYKDYKDHLIDQAALMLTLSGRVRETNQVLATQFSFRLRTPDLIIKVGQTIHQEHITSEKIKISIQIWFVFLLCSSLSQPIGKAVVGEKMAVEISFTNPLPQVLKAVIFHVEGLGLLPARKINYGWGGKIYFISCLFFFKLPCLSSSFVTATVISCPTLRDIGSSASVSLTEHFVPTLPGPRKLLASLDCKQLTQVHGVTDITVEEKSTAAL